LICPEIAGFEGARRQAFHEELDRAIVAANALPH
jgi:hypothetical protein